MGGLLLCPKICGISELLHSLGVKGTWVLLSLCSYYLGHLLQGIGNGLELIVGDPVDLICARDGDLILARDSKHKGYSWCRRILVGKTRWDAIPMEVLNATESRFKKLIDSENVQCVKGKLLYQCSVALIDERGYGGQREMYEYREGFYRGSVIAFVFLPIILLVAFWKSSVITCLALVALPLLAAFLSFRRYGRFSEGRVKSTLLGSLFVENQRSKAAEEKSAA
jgi:hypothetical protein